MQQILHAGRQGGIDLGYCVQPSNVAQTLKHLRSPREITVDQIYGAIQDHADAAVRAQKTGFDAVEITSFMGCLMSCILSPYTNRRTDEWGGAMDKRFRFMKEIIEVIRKACGPDFAISLCLNGAELMDYREENANEECLRIMELAEAAGVDLINMVMLSCSYFRFPCTPEGHRGHCS